MRTALPSILLAVACLSLVEAAQAAESRADIIRRTFEAAAGGRLRIDADGGALVLQGHDKSTVEVEIERRVTRGSNAAAAKLLSQHEVRFSEQNGVIEVESDLPDRSGWGWRWGWREPQLRVRIRVLVPRSFDVEASTAGGNIEAAGLGGAIQARTSGGSLQFTGIQGTLHGRTSGGSIRGTDLAGTVDLKTSGGSIDVDRVKGDSLEVSTSGGSIHLAGIDAPLKAHTAGGGISIETSATPVEARTSGGGIDVTITGPVTDFISLRTSAGGVTLNLPEGARFELDAATSAGAVRSDFPIGVTEAGQRSELRGAANGGGPKIHIRTSAGSIRVRRAT